MKDVGVVEFENVSMAARASSVAVKIVSSAVVACVSTEDLVLCVKDGHERTNPDFAMYDMAIPEKPHRDTEGHKMLNDFWIGTPGVH